MPPDIILDFHPAQNQNRQIYLLKRIAEHAQRENKNPLRQALVPQGRDYFANYIMKSASAAHRLPTIAPATTSLGKCTPT